MFSSLLEPIQSIGHLFSTHDYTEIDIGAVFVSQLGVIYLIGGDQTIKQKMHLISQNEERVTQYTMHQTTNEIHNAETIYHQPVVRLNGPSAVGVLSYCYRVVAEVSNNVHPEICRPMLFSGPTFFIYGKFVEAKKMNPQQRDVSGKLKAKFYNEQIFAIYTHEEINVSGRIHIRVTGDRRLIYVTKEQFDDGTIVFNGPVNEQGARARRLELNKWLEQCSNKPGSSLLNAPLLLDKEFFRLIK